MNAFPGITTRTVKTPRYTANVREREGAGDVPLVFVHGNVSSSAFWQPTMRALGERSLAIDLRGFGDSEVKPVDATRGVRDFSDDVAAVLEPSHVAVNATVRACNRYLFGSFGVEVFRP